LASGVPSVLPKPFPPASLDGVTRLILVRHGESKATVRRTIGGPRSCDGLSELGRTQAERLHDRLAATGELVADALYASGYPRARETAEAIAPALGLPVLIDPAWGEHDPGPDSDGLTFDEFVARNGSPDWEADVDAVLFPSGETMRQFHARIDGAVQRVLTEHEGGTVVVVCHGGVVDAVMRTALHAPALGAFDLFTRNTSLTEFLVVRPDRWRLERYNDAAHLAGLPSETPRAPASV
jgi:probable phosphoglycerate mutase